MTIKYRATYRYTSTTGNPWPKVSPGRALSVNFVVSPSFVLFATGFTGTVSDDGYSYTALT